MQKENDRREIDYERPFLYPKQDRAFFGPERYSWVEASTKAGKTHACIVWLVEKAVLDGFAGWNGWWVAPTGNQAKIAYRRIKNSVPKEFIKWNDSEAWIEFINGARLWFKTAEKPDNLYGEDVYAAVYDEASRGRYDAFVALRSTLTATRGPIRLIGNVKGKSNWFYLQCRAIERRQAAGEDMNAHFSRITAYDAVEAGVLEADEIADAKDTLTEEEFSELYLAMAADDEDAFIPTRFIDLAIQRRRENTVRPSGPLIIGGDPSQGKGDPAAFAFRRGPVIEEVEEHKSMDEFGFIAHVMRLVEARKPAAVFIDGTGFGTTIVKLLHEKGQIYRDIVKGFHMAEAPDAVDEYKNKRAECWGEMRKWLLDKGDPASLPDDDGLSIELGVIRKVPSSSGKLQLEGKAELKARGYDSPNKADACSLTFAEKVSFYTTEKITYPEARRRRNLT